MSCYYPVLVAQDKYLGGKVIFPRNSEDLQKDFSKYKFFFIPCGKCIGCKKSRARNWTVRCTHESQMYSKNCFITLTYDDDHLPPDGSLHYDHFQAFMKRLRKVCKGVDTLPDGSNPLRFYMCGEYGSKTKRPHFHAIIFNFDFPDKTVWKKSGSGHILFRSKLLEQLWPFGYSSVGVVTSNSIAYVTRYMLSKVYGDVARDHYISIDEESGEISQLIPEFNYMSLKPGIGKLWFDRFASDVYPHDFVVHDGKKLRPPRYYDTLLKTTNPDLYNQIVASRIDHVKKSEVNSTLPRVFWTIVNGVCNFSNQKDVFDKYLKCLHFSAMIVEERVRRLSFRGL